MACALPLALLAQAKFVDFQVTPPRPLDNVMTVAGIDWRLTAHYNGDVDIQGDPETAIREFWSVFQGSGVVPKLNVCQMVADRANHVCVIALSVAVTNPKIKDIQPWNVCLGPQTTFTETLPQSSKDIWAALGQQLSRCEP